MNARSLGGLLVLVTVCASSGCAEHLVGTAPGDGSVYDELWTAFERGYGPFAQRGVDWAGAYARHEPAAGATPEAVYRASTDLLSELDDGHVTLRRPGLGTFVAQASFRDRAWDRHFARSVVVRYLEGTPRHSGAAMYGSLPSNVGYVHVAHWSAPIPDLGALMAYLGSHDAVVVDLRHNPGGDFTNSLPFAGHFADVRRLAFTTETRTGTGRDAFGPPVSWFVEPTISSPFTGAVVVLTNGYTNSAAERAVMALRVLPNVTVVGTTTAGNLGEKVGHELSNGWTYTLVPQVVRAPDGRSYEGPGLPPDHLIANDPDGIAESVDQQLEFALALLSAPQSPG